MDGLELLGRFKDIWTESPSWLYEEELQFWMRLYYVGFYKMISELAQHLVLIS